MSRFPAGGPSSSGNSLVGGCCPDCQATSKTAVYRSGAGFYVGNWCRRCGPYSRESGYYPSREGAEVALATAR